MSIISIGILLCIFFLMIAVPAFAFFLVWIVMRFRRNETLQPKRPETDRIRRANDEGVRRVETAAACPECGAALSADSPEGLCPRCLLHHALKTPSPTPTDGPNGRFVAPDPADLAPHFPQLEILALLGQGGMGAVYKARQLKLDRFVAVKILPAEWGRDPAFAERFAREARALARLSHPHIVGVHDFGEAGEHFYLVMEFVDGANLRQLLQTGPLDPRLALQIIPQVCDALQYAHGEGVIHRDVKPENILVDQRGRVKMADFGLAKLVGPSRASFTLTGTNQVMGTLDYMAPEQRNHPQEVDQRADIYSLGVVFYEMLTGELPLGRFSPPSQAAGVDGRLDEIVHRALEREPEQRYQHVSEVKSALESVTDGTAKAVQIAAPVDTETVPLQVQGPAAALIISALIAPIFWLFVAAYYMSEQLPDYHYGSPTPGGRPVYTYEPTPILTYVTPLVLIVSALALAGVIVAGAIKLRRFSGYGFVVASLIIAMAPWSPHCLIGLPAGIWALWALSDPKVRAAFAANLPRKRKLTDEPAPHKETGSTEYVQLQVQGPAAALTISALIALAFWAVNVAYIISDIRSRHYYELNSLSIYAVPFALTVSALMLTGVIMVGAGKMRRFNGYGFVIAASILAMLPWSFHCLIGIPAAIWTFRTLDRPEVKAAFAANLRRKWKQTSEPAPRKETGPIVRKARSFWHSLYSVFLSSPRQSGDA